MIMTREEQIKEYCASRGISSINAQIATDAIKWADATMIEKTCDWIQMDAKRYVRSIGGCMYFDVVNAIDNFKRAMEE